MARTLMRNRNSGFFFMILIAMSVVLLVVVSFSLNQTPTPIVQVKDYSINPNKISLNNQATLSFSLKNDDNKNTHYITVYFNTSSSVTLLMGTSPLPIGNGDSPYFTATLDPSQQSTFYLTVTGTLPSQTSSSTYPIVLNFFVDGKQFDSKQTSIIVQG